MKFTSKILNFPLFIVILLFLASFPGLLRSEESGPSDLSSTIGNQNERRAQKRFYVGGFGINELSWLQAGYNLSGRFSISFLAHQRHRADHFDLDRTAYHTGAVAFSLQNKDFTQNQYTIALEWFPFTIPYYFSIGVGQEFYFQRDRKSEFWVYSDGSAEGRTWQYSISNKRAFVAPGAGLRYVFSSGIFLNGGFNVLMFTNSSAHIQREDLSFYNQKPDPATLERIWKDGKEKELDRAKGIGIQLFLSAGISF
ncbi:hypothetical protein A0128_03730 [Leptospira tipperaryensis]|uniref:Outer membrane protein beta-barrel domain-containing protein n=1 Tax=Leptospira tipperaryensis TaxID=2564040 RepID=A0A1D7UU15_9LEPT|nr:hypothetical protein [Leptospira tipperaryensis]AOP33048.1 hypothetical protein A0128_03730 [Leptospira tipperaryensis]